MRRANIPCPQCGSTERDIGYGLAAGPLGAYQFCTGCEILLEFIPDTDGFTKEQTDAAIERRNTYMKKVWGPDWKP